MTRRFGFNPDWVVHPGETLREWREENHLPVTAAATACARMPLWLYQGVEAGTEPIDDQVASAVAHGTGIPATLWLNLERIFRAGLAAGKTWTPASEPAA
jgi:plasmid maintenance system antidote protein VapI